ncbi:hypothetical protein L596_012249 [Steinernema carpocapsae]|uniref:Anaphase-promoting complex subunit 4-like WD40 domain-containing protein n=1 Tax=Steinernema carpocapsae TaxID=34508 RepID=A0A4U5NXB7_STECR|nr:hypothetical protein L596_012249 [Steinernema carpocapsae]
MASKPTPTFVHRGFDGGTACCSLLPRNELLLVGTSTGRCVAFFPTTHVQLFTVFEDEEKRAVTNCGETEEFVFVHVRGFAVVVGTIEARKFEAKKTIPATHFGFCRTIACGKKLIVPEYENLQHYILVTDLSSDSRIGPLTASPRNAEGNPAASPMAIVILDEEGSKLAVGFEEGVIRVYNVPNREEIASVSAFKDVVFDLSFDAKSGILAASSSESPIRLFRCGADGSLEPIRDIEFPEWSKGCSTLAFSPGGRLLSAGFWNGFTRIYSMKSGKMLCSLDYHEETINFISWCERGNETPLHICSQDGKLTIWNMYKDKTA